MTPSRWTVLLVIVGATFVPRSVTAQDGTIEQLVATALERSPALGAARAAVASAAGQVEQARLKPNPTLSGSQMLMTGSQRQSLVEIDWPLELFRRAPRVAAAQQAAEAASLSVQDRERLLAANVRRHAGRLLAARRNVDVMNEAIAAARRTRELLDARVTEGGIPRLDANIAAVELGRMETELALARADADASTIALKALAGLPADATLTLRDTLEGLTAANPADATPPVAAAAVASRPDLREATARVALANARVEVVRSEGNVDMSLMGNYGLEKYGFAQRGFDNAGRIVPIEGQFHSFVVGAALTLPIRNHNQGALTSAEADRNGSEQLLAARQLEAQAELDAAVLLEREARHAVEMYNTGIRDLARQNVEVQLEAYDLGRTPLSDLLAEQRRYLEVEAAYTDVLARAYEAQVALREARGDIR